MRILLLGEASNLHRSLSQALRAMGHDVTVCSDGGGWMQLERDVPLPKRRPGKVGGLLYWLSFLRLMKRSLNGYDAVSISNPTFLSLRPRWIKMAFDWLKKHNGKIFLTALGTDSFYVRECLSPGRKQKYSEILIYDKPGPYLIQKPGEVKEYLTPEMVNHCRYIYDNIDGAAAVLCEYYWSLEKNLPTEKIWYMGIPIDVDKVKMTEPWKPGRKIRIFLGRHSYRQHIKGSDLLEVAAHQVVSLHPDLCEFVLVEDKPYEEFVNMLIHSDIVLDQIYSYTPATTALLAMAMGKTVVSGGEEDFYNFIGEDKLRPIVNAGLTVEELTRQIEELVLNPGQLAERGRQGREFVEKHNSGTVVAGKYLEMVNSRIQS